MALRSAGLLLAPLRWARYEVKMSSSPTGQLVSYMAGDLPASSSTGVHFCCFTHVGSMQLSVLLIGTSMSWLPSTTSRPPLVMLDGSTLSRMVRCLTFLMCVYALASI